MAANEDTAGRLGTTDFASRFASSGVLLLRWLGAGYAAVVLVGLWLPAVHSEPPEARTPEAFTLLPVLVAAALLAVIAVAVPLSRRARAIVVGTLAVLTAAAWIFEDAFREILGPPFL